PAGSSAAPRDASPCSHRASPPAPRSAHLPAQLAKSSQRRSSGPLILRVIGRGRDNAPPPRWLRLVGAGDDEIFRVGITGLSFSKNLRKIQLRRSSMNGTFLNACASFVVVLSITFASDAEAQDCTPLPGGPIVSPGPGVKTLMANSVMAGPHLDPRQCRYRT